MQFFEKEYPGRIHQVFYENMIEDQETTTQALCEYLGLKWEERCLKFHERQTLVKTASRYQVRKPIYRSSVATWKHYKPFITPLIDILQNDIDAYEVNRKKHAKRN